MNLITLYSLNVFSCVVSAGEYFVDCRKLLLRYTHYPLHLMAQGLIAHNRVANELSHA